MYTIDQLIDVFCPQCANEQVYVERIATLEQDEGDAYACRCGKCGWRFRVIEPGPYVIDVPGLANDSQKNACNENAPARRRDVSR
jgi:hypothetical protein